MNTRLGVKKGGVLLWGKFPQSFFIKTYFRDFRTGQVTQDSTLPMQGNPWLDL